MLSWFVLLIFGLAFLLAMLIVVPIGFVALAASPDVRRFFRTGAAAIAPFALIAFGLLFVFGWTTKVVHHPPITEVLQMHSPPPPPVVVVSEGHPTTFVATEAEAPTPTVNPNPVLDSQSPVSIIVYDDEQAPPMKVSELPAWATAAPERDAGADTELFTLQSGRYSSIEEAEGELLQLLRQPLDSYLRRGGVSIDVQQLSRSDILRTGLRRSCVVEQFDLVLPSTVEPVYRVTWQVSLRPVVREVLGADFRIASRDQRLWQLGLGAGLLTLLFGTWAVYFRIDDNTQGRYRSRLKLAAIGATLAQGAVLFIA